MATLVEGAYRANSQLSVRLINSFTVAASAFTHHSTGKEEQFTQELRKGFKKIPIPKLQLRA